MARTRRSWDWIDNYPVFVYTTFLDHNVFNVKIVVGEKGNQNAEGFGPTAKPYAEYISTGFTSKDEVVNNALLWIRFEKYIER